MAPEPLEDDFAWVLRKALKGHSLAPARAATLAGLSAAEVLAFSRGRFTAATARRLAPALGLDPDAFAAHPGYHPHAPLPAAVTRLPFPFDGGSVNAWLVRAAATTLLIDAGADPAALRAALARAAATPTDVLVTHPHGDHVGGLPAVTLPPAAIRAPAAARLPGAVVLTPGDRLACGPLAVRVLDLDGHWPGHLGLLIEGLDAPLCAVGDALFAGSVGGTPDPRRYQLELGLLHRHVLSLPGHTLLLPGHGPPTTVDLERRHNPFLATPAPGRPPGHG